MTIGSFRSVLVGGSKRELHNDVVIEAVLADRSRVGELFACVLADDEHVRMRAADALEKVCRSDPAVVAPLTAWILTDMAGIDQPSVQWHFAQIVAALPLTDAERRRAVRVLKRNLEISRDWIVLNLSMQALARFAEDDAALRRYLIPKLDGLRNDQRKSVASTARRLHDRLSTVRAPAAELGGPPVRTERRPPKNGHAGGPLNVDPVGPLLASGDAALLTMVRRDLLGQKTVSTETLWELPEARRIFDKQRADGRWSYPGGNPAVRRADDYDQLETYRQLAVLVHKYGVDRRHPAVGRAREFLASFQTDAGDYRGIYGRQYTPNYSAAITELLIVAGYRDTAQVGNTMRWLLSMRQHDGGWAIPTRTLGLGLEVMSTAAETFEPDLARPSSHLITGIVLRAFAAHPRYRRSAATHRAGEVLKSRFFSRDVYPDHIDASYWLTFSYPFWWTDLLSALDSLTKTGFRIDDPDIARGVAWFVDNQEPNGLWNNGRNRPKNRHSDHWVGFAVCRMLNAAGTAMPSSSETALRPPSRVRRSGTSASIALTPSDEPSR